jgi:membrane protein DedA with SNARE-associated domain
MKLKNFLFYTFLGSGIWTVVLAILGYFLGTNEKLLAKYYREISLIFVAAAFIIVLMLILRRNKRSE